MRLKSFLPTKHDFGISTSYLFGKLYINYEHKSNKLDAKAIVKVIESILDKAQDEDISTIVLKSYIMVDPRNTSQCRRYFVKQCKNFNAKCNTKKASFVDKLAYYAVLIYIRKKNPIKDMDTIGICIIDLV